VKLIAENGFFIRTNADGSAVLYHKGNELYRWTDAGGEDCLTCGVLPPGVIPADVRASDDSDFSRIYFTSPGPGPEPEKQFGFPIYLLEDGQVTYLTSAHSDVGGSDYKWDATPDGRTVVFMSVLPTTTADDTGWNGYEQGLGEENGGQSAQLYRYSVDNGYVECVSCKGEKGPADGGLFGGILNGNFTVSDDGSTIAYATEATLVRDDINRAMDVYEWHNGVIRLVTNGESEFPRTFFSAPRLWGASDDGRVLAFSAGGAELTGHERNHFSNAYAAVVGGPGFPPPNPPAHCTEDSCQGPLQPSPPLDFQGSSAFNGPGSPVPQRGGGKKKHKKGKHKKKHKKRTSTRKHG
jgi:hypothetical protein